MQPVTIVNLQCWCVAGRAAGSSLKLLLISSCRPCAFARTSSSALGGPASHGHILFPPFLPTEGTRPARPATRASGSQLVRVHYDCPSVFPVGARPPLPGPLLSIPKPSTNRRCALSVASLLDRARLACALDRHPSLRNTFNLHPHNQRRPNGRPIPLLGPLPPLPPQHPRLQHLPQDPG